VTRSDMPALFCDADDGCDDWAVDFYAATASSVGGVKITAAARAPGWTSTPDGDLCPAHSPVPAAPGAETAGGAGTRARLCPTKTPEPHEAGEFPMTCYRCHIEADS
jgi:hypothetical protein